MRPCWFPVAMGKMLVAQVSANRWYTAVHSCTCYSLRTMLTFQQNTPYHVHITCFKLTVMSTGGGGGGVVVDEEAAKPVTTVWDWVSTFVSVTLSLWSQRSWYFLTGSRDISRSVCGDNNRCFKPTHVYHLSFISEGGQDWVWGEEAANPVIAGPKTRCLLAFCVRGNHQKGF